VSPPLTPPDCQSRILSRGAQGQVFSPFVTISRVDTNQLNFSSPFGVVSVLTSRPHFCFFFFVRIFSFSFFFPQFKIFFRPCFFERSSLIGPPVRPFFPPLNTYLLTLKAVLRRFSFFVFGPVFYLRCPLANAMFLPPPGSLWACPPITDSAPPSRVLFFFFCTFFCPRRAFFFHWI